MRVRGTNLLLGAALIAASWLGMMVVHELGHLLHAWLSGGSVTRVVLDPLAFSRTDVSPNPHPLLVAWGGVIWGSILPLAAWYVARLKKPPAGLPRFFAGFCFAANGVYLAAAPVLAVGDTEDLVRLGTTRWLLSVLGLTMVAAGFRMWHGLGARLGPRAAPNRPALAAALIALGILLVAMLAWTAATR